MKLSRRSLLKAAAACLTLGIAPVVKAVAPKPVESEWLASPPPVFPTRITGKTITAIGPRSCGEVAVYRIDAQGKLVPSGRTVAFNPSPRWPVDEGTFTHSEFIDGRWVIYCIEC